MQNNISFKKIAYEIINTKKFKDLKNEKHHGITRQTHVLRVSKYTYKISKMLRMDYISATRAALLHDYFTNKDMENSNSFKRGIKHPDISYINACKDFQINKLEKNAIISHMFPLCHEIPKYKESWVLTIVDKCVAAYEMTRFKLSNTITLYMIFFANMILFYHN